MKFSNEFASLTLHQAFMKIGKSLDVNVDVSIFPHSLLMIAKNIFRIFALTMLLMQKATGKHKPEPFMAKTEVK